jgi:hypothetical protein
MSFFKQLKEKFKTLFRSNILERRTIIINGRCIDKDMSPEEAARIVKESDALFDSASKQMDAMFEDLDINHLAYTKSKFL